MSEPKLFAYLSYRNAPAAVMATWDFRSRKRPFELSLPSSFSLSDGTGSSIQEGYRSRSPVKTQV